MPDNDHLFFLERDEGSRLALEEPPLARPAEPLPSPTFTLVLTVSGPDVHGLEMVVGQADFQRAMDRGDIVIGGVDTRAHFEVIQPVTFGQFILALGTRFSIRQSNTYSTVRPGVTHPNRGALAVDAQNLRNYIAWGWLIPTTPEGPLYRTPRGFNIVLVNSHVIPLIADEVIEVVTPVEPNLDLERPALTTQEFHTPYHSTAGLELPPARPAWIRNAIRAITTSLAADGLGDAQIQRVINLLLTPGSGLELAQAPTPSDDEVLEAITRRRDAATVDGQVLGPVLRVTPPTPEPDRRSVWDRLGDDDDLG